MLYKSLATLSSGQDKEDILGAWFMWPEGGHERPRDLPQDSTLIVYFHGNSQDRGFGHRVRWRFQTSPNKLFSSTAIHHLSHNFPHDYYERALFFKRCPSTRCCLVKVSTCLPSTIALLATRPGSLSLSRCVHSGYMTIDSCESKSIKYVVAHPKNNNLGNSIRAPLSIRQLFVYVWVDDQQLTIARWTGL